jgi:hypothetical protein
MKQHPTMDTLLAYLDDAENSDFAEVRLHIATCRDCRASIDNLTRLQQSVRDSGPFQHRLAEVSAQLASALDQQAIERYVDGELDATQRESIAQLLNSEPNALKAALHYASHSTASYHLREETQHPAAATSVASPQTTTAKRTATSASNGLIEQLKKFMDFRPPVWISVPATAAVVFIMTIAVLPDWSASTPHFTVAAYQDKPVIHYQGEDQLPGIGFFNKAHRSTVAFGPMEIRYNDNLDLSLHWPQVPKAAHYHLALYLISEGQKITVQEKDLTENQTTLVDFKAEAGKRYEWTLNGKTSDAQSFYATGGFVINAAINTATR